MKKILIIDDEEDLCLFVKQNLEISGRYAVTFKTSGKDGLESVAGDRPDLILLDLIMPKMGGFEVLKKLRASEATKQIPVVILTAVGYDLSKERAKSFSVEGYLVKPVFAKDLLAKVNEVLEGLS